MKTKENYRLGIDMGSTSIGWCMLKLNDNNEPYDIINMGVRIFPDGRDDKSKEPLSVKRRNYRSMRRNLDRYLLRREQLLHFLDEHSLLPKDENERTSLFIKDPLEIRVKALDKEISLYEFSRAIIHLSKRRGFKSNRKDSAKEKGTKISDAILNLQTQLENSNARSLGEYLYNINSGLALKDHNRKKPSKFKYESDISEEKIFPTRDMVEHEFDLLWKKQSQYHKELTESIGEELKNIIFYQRPLKPTEKGKCYLEPTEERIAKAHPLFQQFRLLQEINNLQLINIRTGEVIDLTQEQRNTIFQDMNVTKEKEYEKVRALLFKSDYEDYIFNFEKGNKKKLKGNESYHALKSKLKTKYNALSDEEKNYLIELLISHEEDEVVSGKLKAKGYSYSEIDNILNISLPSGTGSLSLKAISKIIPLMMNGIKYSDACVNVGYNHSNYDPNVDLDDEKYPYYGKVLQRSVLPVARTSHDEDADQFGKINNPTVHIALNQIRRIITALTDRYGEPKEISIELARDSAPSIKMVNAYKSQLGIPIKNNEEESLFIQYQRLIKKVQEKNEENNNEIAKELAILDKKNNYDNRFRYKLWVELAENPLERCCVYTGRQIKATDLFSSNIDIEHILPKSRTYDDSYANKTLCFRDANIKKGEKSPYEAFGHNPDGFDWVEILKRANNLPENKKWRFTNKAMEKFEDENEILDRMLNDTRYMSILAKEYLQPICEKIINPTGRLTSDLRLHWGLNSLLSDSNKKERTDHRHHAIDAFVIAMASQSMIQKYANAIKDSPGRFISNLPQPWNGFSMDNLNERVNRIRVSYKPDQPNPKLLRTRMQTVGPLMEDTALSFYSEDPDNAKMALFTQYKKISSFINKEQIIIIKSEKFRDELLALRELYGDDGSFKKALKEWADKNNVKRLKVIQKNDPLNLIPIKDKNGKIYKYYASKENLYIDIYNPEPGNPKSVWQDEVINIYNAHIEGFIPRWKMSYPKAKLIMRLYKDDIVAYTNSNNERELRRVRRFSQGRIFLRELHIAQKEKNDEAGEPKSAKQLQQLNAAKAGIDIIGRVFDPNREQ
ncbi:MAG TPA: type II CRISPR RNA-guided endonuclease Cas9 [Candidatus Cloacimonadota bacterium]|nr:type II CRISPR RNA-guided endonuclease Cas9 [Candidatus Cloacimonadota bacterium]